MNFKNCIIVTLLWYSCSLNCLSQVLFTPRDDIRSQLLKLIKEERKSIDCAVYMFTDKTMAQALIDAYVRGVRIRVVLDQISMGERFGKGLFLQKNGVVVFIHQAGLRFNQIPIMHHKFFIFGCNEKTQKELLWTGSFNCTASASTMHDENVIITDDVSAIEQYRECFSLLMKRLSHDRSGNNLAEELQGDSIV